MVRKYFNRYEIKYQLDLSERDKFIKGFPGFMQLDPHTVNGRDYEIRSVYYDSIHREAYFEKCNGVKIRRKLRIRYYPDTDQGEDARAFIEIKRKLNENVSKARIIVPLNHATEVLDCNNPYAISFHEKANMQDKKTLEEVWFLMRRYNLKPVCMVNYHRQAYMGKVENRFRITFDTNLTVRNQNFDLRVGGGTRFIIPKHRTVMEVKFNGFIPYWAINMIQFNDCIQEKISKFATGLKRVGTYSLI